MRRIIAPLLVGFLAVLGVAGYALAGGGSQSVSLVSSSQTSSPQSSGPNNALAIPCPLVNNGTSNQTTEPSLPRHVRGWVYRCCGVWAKPGVSKSSGAPKILRRCCGVEDPTNNSNGVPGLLCRAKEHRRFLFGLLHAFANKVAHLQAIVDIKGSWTTINVDNGTVGAVSSSSITVNRLDGVQVSDNLTSSTKYLGIKPGKIAVGDRVIVASENGNALYLLTRAPKSVNGNPTSSTTTTSVPPVVTSVPVFNPGNQKPKMA